MAHWLVKSEPSTWSFDDQLAAGEKGTSWNGVRNHSAKPNLMAMKVGEQAFFYHMWAEAYIDKRWIPIDGTLAQGGIGAAHLKIAQSSLKDATAYSAFLPVTQILSPTSCLTRLSCMPAAGSIGLRPSGPADTIISRSG